MDWFSLPVIIAGAIIGLFGDLTRSEPAKPSGLQPMAYICETTDTGFTHGDEDQLSCEWRFVK
jgi:hypothetical protein